MNNNVHLLGGTAVKMKRVFHFLALTSLFLDRGVFGIGIVEVSVKDGDSVTLNTALEHQQHRIIWYFNEILIAQINGNLSFICTDVQCNEGTERFRDRLKLDHQTGSLTIMNTRNTDTGEYKLKIINSSIVQKIFSISVNGVFAAKQNEVKKGESVTLDPGEINHPNDVMKWYFNEILITEITGDQSKICTDDLCDGRFRDRLKLDHQTGSLTIMNTKITDEGEYKLQIIIISSSFSISRVKRFSVSVIAVPGADLSSDAIIAICGVVGVVAVVLLAAAVVAVIYCCRRSIYKSVAQRDAEADVPDSKRHSLN